MRRYKKLHRYHRCVLLLLGCLIYFSQDVFASDIGALLPSLGSNDIKVGNNVDSLSDFIQFTERGLKMLYLIFRPLLAIAAAAMDNSLVYGGAFHLTPMLFKFWQIIRTFANYTIGLYFVGSLLAAFFGNKLENVFSSLIKNVALATVIVNLSRWIMATLIDFSTIATVALGALPLHALKNDAVFQENVYYLKTYANMNQNASTDKKADQSDFSMMYGCGTGATTRYYLPCAVNHNQLLYKGANNEQLTRKQYKQDFLDVRKGDPKINTDNIDDFFCVYGYGKDIISNEYGADLSNCKKYTELMVDGKDEGISQCSKVNDILTKAVGNTGPLYTIFSSILHMSELGISTNTGTATEVGLNLLIKLVFGIAMIIPLIALAVVMIIRVVYLWLIIAFSPLITIAVALQRGEKIGGKIDGVLKNVLKPTQIISLVFLPVIATFGLSISIIFLTLLQKLPLIETDIGRSESAKEQPDGCPNDIGTALGMTRDKTPEGVSYSMDVTTLNFAKAFRETGSDIGNILAWTLINFFGVALMWMVVFATLKTNEFTKGIADTIDSTAKKRMGTIPLPFAGGLGAGALGKIPEMLENKFVNKGVEEQSALLESSINNEMMKHDPETKKIEKELAEGAKNPENLAKVSGLNRSDIAEGTSYTTSYGAAPEVYGKKAKSYFYDEKSKSLTAAGKNYANITKQSEADVLTKVSGLDKITKWDEALGNQEFLHYMDEANGGGGYDKFLPNRHKVADKASGVRPLEKGLEKASGDGNHGEKIAGGVNTHWYLRNNKTKLTTFNRRGNKFDGDQPETISINNNGDPKTRTTKDIDTMNKILTLEIENKVNDTAFFKAFQENGAMKAEITIGKDANQKTYTGNKDANGRITQYAEKTATT